MCLVGSAQTPPPPAPPPARAPATLDVSNLDQKPSKARIKRAKGKRAVRNNTGLGVGGKGNAALSIPSKSTGGTK